MQYQLGEFEKDVLYEKLKDPDFAAGYLTACYEENCTATFLGALHDVLKSLGGISSAARLTKLGRQNIYRILSKDGNPTLDSLTKLLNHTGLRITFMPIRRKAQRR